MRFVIVQILLLGFFDFPRSTFCRLGLEVLHYSASIFGYLQASYLGHKSSHLPFRPERFTKYPANFIVIFSLFFYLNFQFD